MEEEEEEEGQFNFGWSLSESGAHSPFGDNSDTHDTEKATNLSVN